MIPLEQAYSCIDAAAERPAPRSESVPLDRALGRICGADQFARVDLPPFHKSAVDGYAIPDGDRHELFTVLETVAAGEVPTQALSAGQATKVMTGAPVPEGTARVVMVEHTTPVDAKVRVTSETSGANICAKGEDVTVGDRVLSAGQRIGPAEVGSLAAAGITTLDVAPPLCVAVFSTGDEITDKPEDLRPGCIMNSNGPMLAALCYQQGWQVLRQQIVRDNKEATDEALTWGCQEADVVVLSGGVSVGDYDYVGQALTDLGFTVHFDRVAVKPGKPATFATSPQAAVFGLPGNPVAAYVTFHLFVLRYARRRLGLTPDLSFAALPLAEDFQRRRADRQEFLPCRLTEEGTLERLRYHGSAHLQSLVGADGFFVVPVGVTSLARGDKVAFTGEIGRFA